MKAIHVIISIAALALLAPVASAVIINTPGDYPTIQEGIDAAQNGDTVLVAPGEYWENPIIEDKNILLASAQGPENTTIRGYMMIRGESVDTTCVLRGFTITKDNTDPMRTPSLLRIHYASPLIVGNIIRDSNTWDLGGGIQCAGSEGIIRGNIIRNNFTRSRGGGIFSPANVLVERNNIYGNRAGYLICEGGGGGGIWIGYPGIIRYNLIVDNESVLYGCPTTGGGISMGFSSHSHVYNNTIVGNSARMGYSHSRGGGIYFATNGQYIDKVFKNNIIAFNPYGGGVYAIIHDSGYVDWDYNLVFGNGGGDYIGMEPGPHDIQEDPLFVDRFSGDYHLLPNSPCIDAGDPDFPLDPDGSRADIGAYYFDQTVGIEDPGEPSGPYQFQLHQNYPNPFNSQTIISYYLSEESVVSLHIYSITGHFVEALANKEVQTSGEHKYVWDGKDKNDRMVSTGIYFYELYVDDYRESKAMILIK